MDRIEFVVAHQELGLGRQLCAEPVINGTNLVKVLKRCDGTSVGYAGLAPDQLFRNLSQTEPSFDAQILRCTCGDDGSSWARTVVDVRQDDVAWHDFRASGARATSYSGVGPYRFAREEYDRRLSELSHAETR